MADRGTAIEQGQSIEELVAERKYLLRWFNGFNAELTGLSADALTIYAYYGGEPHNYPRDKGDLGRCERAYAAMPPHLQKLALPLLEKWRDDLKDAKY
jgi:hypothetical protein